MRRNLPWDSPRSCRSGSASHLHPLRSLLPPNVVFSSWTGGTGVSVSVEFSNSIYPQKPSSLQLAIQIHFNWNDGSGYAKNQFRCHAPGRNILKSQQALSKKEENTGNRRLKSKLKANLFFQLSSIIIENALFAAIHRFRIVLKIKPSIFLQLQ